jgi:hypothetical protein
MQILVTYFQILGSFTSFSITWPPLALIMFSWFETTFKFEILQMPGSDPRPIISSSRIDDSHILPDLFEHDNTRRLHAQSSCDIMLSAPSY